MHIDDISSFETFDGYEQATLTYVEEELPFALRLIITKYENDDGVSYYIQGQQAEGNRLSQYIPISLDGFLRGHNIHDIETDNTGVTGPHSKEIASVLSGMLEKYFRQKVSMVQLGNTTQCISHFLQDNEAYYAPKCAKFLEKVSELEPSHHVTLPLVASPADHEFLSYNQRELDVEVQRIVQNCEADPLYIIKVQALGKDTILSCKDLEKSFSYPPELARHCENCEGHLGPYSIADVARLTPYFEALSDMLFAASMLVNSTENLRQALAKEKPDVIQKGNDNVVHLTFGK